MGVNDVIMVFGLIDPLNRSEYQQWLVIDLRLFMIKENAYLFLHLIQHFCNQAAKAVFEIPLHWINP